MFNSSDIKKDFPLFSHYPKLVFADNASTTQKPEKVIESISNYYLYSNANVHRAVYDLGIESDEIYHETRELIKKFYAKEEAIFTSGTTDGFNKIARALKQILTEKNNIVVSEMEHHSNLLPWQAIAHETGGELRIARITPSGELDLEHLYSLIDNKTVIVSLVHISNTLGTINKLEEVGDYLKGYPCSFIVDAAQSCAFHQEEIKEIDADAFVFGAHKMFGPSGIGVILAKKHFLKIMGPFNLGGGMVTEVNMKSSDYRRDVSRFEGGTPPLAQVAGLKAAVEYLLELDLAACRNYVSNLARELRSKLEAENAVCFGPRDQEIGGIVSATFGNIHPHDVASFLNSKDIAVRAGHHCTQLIMKKYEINSSVRFSLTIYNSKEDVERIVEAVREMKVYFG